MKVSRQWLQRFFDKELPDTTALADALTFHAFEIEEVYRGDASIDDILDVKVTANRGHDCLCHRGIAKELSAILQIPMKSDPLRVAMNLEASPLGSVSVSIEDPALCQRYIAGYIKGVKVGPSPDWLRKNLESVGQKSINNVVDAANFVMFDMGQPLHAFDAGQLAQKNGYSIGVRRARAGEKLLALDDKEYTVAEHMLVITDNNSDAGIGIAGVKGGKPAGITEATTDIIIESANFDGVATRKTAATLKLRTDASSRYEQVISPELCAYGMQAVVALIQEVAGGEVVGFADEYAVHQQQKSVSVEAKQINAVLGSKLSDAEIADALTRLDLPFTKLVGAFVVEPPFERLDLTIPEDIAEEVGRIIGYDKILPVELPVLSAKPEVNQNFYAAEKTREELVAKGYSEVFTSVFADKGERVIANKVDGVRPYLRTTLVDGLKDAYEKNRLTKDLLGLVDVKLFEIAVVWPASPKMPSRGGKSGEEHTMLGIADKEGVREEPLIPRCEASRYEDLPLSQAQRFQPFSKYPFIVRDIAVWVPDTDEARGLLISIFGTYSEGLLRHVDLFDQFKKDGKNSLAFHLVFQSFEKTLTDGEANTIMENIYTAVKKEGWEVR